MAEPVVISDLRIVLTAEHRDVIYRQRAGVFDERVRGEVIGYRTFVADGKIFTDVLCETVAGAQEFKSLTEVTFLRRASQIPGPARTVPAAAAPTSVRVDDLKPF